MIRKIQVIDSHTGGEPTRVVVAGGPLLGRGSLADRAQLFITKHDEFRSAVVNEPRGSDVLVGALLCEPVNPQATCGVIFFNNVSVLGMCGHGTIGLIVTLAHMGRIRPGDHLIETPVGDITATLHPDGRVSVRNVPSYRYAAAVPVTVEGLGTIKGDIAWGGNWFFLVSDHGQRLKLNNVERLTAVTWAIRAALEANQITGANGALIDHIELFAMPDNPDNHSRNFVLCPGKAYDRSPCGTGTSAKLACLAANDRLLPGEIWRQESILGSVFEASYQPDANDCIIPTITGTAFVTAEATLLQLPNDPFRDGIRG